MLVACHAGISRSSTIVICYLIQRKKQTAYDAITQIRKNRDVIPSKQQLIYIARMHNKIFGFDNIDVIDIDVSLNFTRKLALKDNK